MKAIQTIHWDDVSEEHLWVSHRVTIDEIEEVIFGVDDEDATYRIARSGDFSVIFGETGGGRLLMIVGEFVEATRFRPFGARDMNALEKRRYRKAR